MPRIPLMMKSAVALVAAALLAAAFQDKPDDQTKKAEEQKASIEGTVVDSAVGKPVKECQLMLMRTNGGGLPISATTDEAGHFVVKNLDAGSYYLFAMHPRYARQMYGSTGAGLTSGTPLTVSNAQALKEITFKLQPNSVISGKVVDEDGEPLQNVMVSALKPMYRHGRREMLPAGTASTNDLGEFRVGNLAASKYLVSATPTRQGDTKAAEGQPESAYLTTYYPNATEPTGAAQVTVAAGADTSGIDIRLIKSKAVSVKGKVIGLAAGQKVNVQLLAKSAGLFAFMMGRSANIKPADGSFEMHSVPPGSYTLRAMEAPGMKAAGPALSLEVGDKPIDGLTLEVVSSPDINGVLIFDADQSQKPPLKGIRIVLEAAEGLSMNVPIVNPAEDGTFQLKSVSQGKYFVRVLPAPEGTYVSSVALGEVKMNEDGLDVGPTGGAKLEIKLRPGAAQVTGVVQGTDGNPVSGVTVALIPESKAYLLYQSISTDQQGAFNLKGITPGSYRLFAWQDIELGAFQDPEFVKPFESQGEKVDLKENGQKGVTLKVIPKS